MSKHTPAPWEFYEESSMDCGDSYGVSAKAPYHWVIPPLSINPNDARLIASAPELLEALKSLVDMHTKHYGLDGAWDEELNKARQAIAKAEKV